MPKYVITVEETLSQDVTIEAESEEEAIKEAMEMYRHNNIVLYADDFTGDVVFKVKQEE